MDFNFIFAAVSSTALLMSPIAAAGPANRVLGVVLDDSGAAVPGAEVVLRRDAVGFEATARTDAEGRFSIAVPVRGDYELSAHRPGFSVVRLSVTITGSADDGLRLTLHPGVLSETIEVVGTRVAGGPEALRRIPGSVEIIGPDQLERAVVFNVSEALRRASGVSVRDEEGFGLRPNLGIRGLNPTRSTKVLLLEDGLPLSFAPYGDNASYYHPPIERFESVEILKGSGQIAYGPVTVGGVVNYITPGTPVDPGAMVRLASGNRGYFNGHAQAGGTWGRTGLLLDYMHKRGDGARENVHSSLNDANLKAVFSLTRRQVVTVKGNFYAEDSLVTYSGLRLAEYLADPRANPFANDSFTGRRLGGSAKHAWAIGDGALLTTQVYAARFSRDWWRQSSSSGQRPNDAADARCGGMANLLTTCGNEGRLRDYDHFGIEPRLRFGHRVLGRASEAEMGVRAHFEVQERRQENGDTPTARSGLVVEDNRRRNQAYSGFFQNRLLVGRVTVTPGLRVEHVRYDRTNRLAAGGAGVSGRTELTQWVPGLGLAWSPRDAVSVFAGVHRGFAPPRTEDVINNTTGGVIDLDPERSWNYELGARTRVHRGVRLDGTLFRMDYENQIVPASLAGGIGATLTNGGQTLHQGLELATRIDTGTLLDSRHNVALRAAFTAVPRARFEGTRLSNVPGFATVSVGGNRLPYAPERLLTASVGYDHVSGVFAMVEAVYGSRQFADDLNTIESSADGQRGLIPASTIWNVTASYAIRRLDARVFVAVKNVFDRLSIADRSRGILPGGPRVVQAGLQARF